MRRHSNTVAVLGMVYAVEMLIHIHRRLIAVWLTDDARRYACGGGMRRHRLQHHGTCADLRAASDFDIAEDFAPAPIITPSRIFG
jgi:hypothetical protein